MDAILQSLRSAARRPAFNGVVVVVMTLSIGLATAALSLAYAVFLRPLPFGDSARLALYCCPFPSQGAGWRDAPGSPAAMKDYRRAATSAEKVAIFYDQQNLDLAPQTGVAHAEHVAVTFADADYFPVLGVNPALGRWFTTEECQSGADRPVAVVSQAFWRDHAAPGAAPGTSIVLGGRTFTVVGVMPAGFRDVSSENGPPAVWLPLPQVAAYLRPGALDSYSVQTFRALVRLKPEVTLSTAQAEADAIATRLAEAQPVSHRGRTIRLMPLREFFFLNLRGPVLLLFAGSLLVLAVGAVNLANLFLVDGFRRAPDLALRAALGANDRELAKTILARLAVPLLGGAIAGILLAAGIVLVLNRAEALSLPDFAQVSLSLPVVGASILLSGLVCLAAGSVPVLRARRPALREALAGGAKGGLDMSGAARARQFLIAGEVALATALLAATGLTIKSLRQILTASDGYNSRQLISLQIQLDRRQLPSAASRATFLRQLNETLQDGPGVEAALLWGPSMLGAAGWNHRVTPGGLDPTDPTLGHMVQSLNTVPGGLSALGVPLLRGRDFSRTPLPEYPVEVVVDQRMADLLWPGAEPLGRTLFLEHDAARRGIVIGVAGPVRNRGRTFDEAASTGDMYTSLYQSPADTVVILLRHSAGRGGAVLDWARSAIARLDPNLALYGVAEMQDRLQRQERSPRLTATLFSLYAGIALVLTAVGIFGVLAFAVAQRRREFAVRLAMGATPLRILLQVLLAGSAWIVLGLVAGIFLALVAAPLLGGVLVGVTPQDPVILGVAAGVVALLSLAATLWPAARAAHTDPLAALRGE